VCCDAETRVFANVADSHASYLFTFIYITSACSNANGSEHDDANTASFLVLVGGIDAGERRCPPVVQIEVEKTVALPELPRRPSATAEPVWKA